MDWLRLLKNSAAGLALALCQCSLLENWNAAQLPCANGNCLPGYSCGPVLDSSQASVCLANGTRSFNQSCTYDVQCNTNLVCFEATCSTTCPLADVYSNSSVCGTDQVCRDFYAVTPNALSSPVRESACAIADGCTMGSSCDTGSGNMCVQVTETATACVVGCEITPSLDGVYTDNCGITPLGTAMYCTPVGLSNQQQLVCMDSSFNPVAVNTPCNLASQPCAPGQGCINGYCRSYCQLSSTSATSNCNIVDAVAFECTEYAVNASTVLGYCQPPDA